MKKARLIEENMNYEDLASKDLYSEDELPLHSSRE
jgi:hypothetical protein